MGQWCNVSAPLPHRLSSAAAFWSVLLYCITVINYSDSSPSLPVSVYCTPHALWAPHLSRPCPLFFWASCNWMEGPQCVCYQLHAPPFYALFCWLISHRSSPSSPFSTHCSACEWLGYLTQRPAILPAGFKNKQGSGFCVGRAALIWWVVGGVVLPAAPDALNYAIHTAAPPPAPLLLLPQTARSCHWKAGIS